MMVLTLYALYVQHDLDDLAEKYGGQCIWWDYVKEIKIFGATRVFGENLFRDVHRVSNLEASFSVLIILEVMTFISLHSK